MSFPTPGQIVRDPLDRIIPTLSTISLDTFYQVTFSFGKFGTWYKGSSSSLGLDVKRKMSLLCAEAELPGTSYAVSTAIGHHQGIVETFPNLRQFPPLNLTFYVDAEHIIIDVWEQWMNYINPVNNTKQLNAFSRFKYPDSYKEVLHVTKYERGGIGNNPGFKPGMYHYEFINVWPTNVTSMKVNYGQSDVLKCSVQLAYDRYFTSKTPSAGASSNSTAQAAPTATASDIINRTPAAFNTDKLPSVVTNEYYNNFGDNTQNSTNFGDFTSGKNTGVFGQAVG